MRHARTVYTPIILEKHFSPGIKSQPLLLMGSQTHEIWKNSAKLQSPEDFYLAALSKNNVAIVRNVDPNYVNYFTSLMENGRVINLFGVDNRDYLSNVLLKNFWALEQIKHAIRRNFKMLPFLITNRENELSRKLKIPIYGSQKINNRLGTKSGIRTLANQAHIPLSPGFICSTIYEIKSAITSLGNDFDFVAIKHDTSASGFLSQKVSVHDKRLVHAIVNHILKRPFREGKDIIVVEGWLKNKASVGAHIEIPPGKLPIICAAWQQIIDTDEVSYIGAGPLSISPKALHNLKRELNRLARSLHSCGAIGSFGPDFLITSDEEKHFRPDSVVLIELNARIPYTAFPLQIIKDVKGSIGSGFFSTHITLRKTLTFTAIAEHLARHNLLIMEKDSHAVGVVPFGVNLLPWRSFHYVAIGNSWNEAKSIARRVNQLFDRYP